MSDRALRAAERRVVEEGTVSALALVIRERLRAKRIKRRDVYSARFFSAPLTPPGSEGVYNWHPLDWGEYNRLIIDRDQLLQDPRTLLLHAALVDVIGPMRIPAQEEGGISRAQWRYALRQGFVVAHTGGVDNHPPFEIQYEQDFERDSIEEEERAVRAQATIILGYLIQSERVNPSRVNWLAPLNSLRAIMAELGEPTYWYGDVAFQHLVLQETRRGQPQATGILKFLRVNSTVEYCFVFGAGTLAAELDSNLFGSGELSLVSDLLGGYPL